MHQMPEKTGKEFKQASGGLRVATLWGFPPVEDVLDIQIHSQFLSHRQRWCVEAEPEEVIDIA